jgi:hypothetical protein
MHHSKKIDEPLVRRFIHECGDRVGPEQRAWTEDEIKSWIARLQEQEYRGSAGFHYPHPWKTGQDKYEYPVQVSHLLRMSTQYQISSGRTAVVPRFEKEGWEWVGIRSNNKHFDHTAVPDMEWFADRVRAAIRFFEPDFGCGALDTQLYKGFQEEPRDFAWPVLIYGREMVAKHGRDKLLSAPVFLAEELPFGAVWLQVAEKPFVMEKAALKPLASHLSLKVAPP